MTIAAGQWPLIGAPAVSNSSTNSVEVATATSGYVPLIPLGTTYIANHPYWGGLELTRMKIPANSSALPVGTLSKIDIGYSYVAIPNTANTGFSVAVLANNVPVNVAYDQYAWFVVSGKFVLNSNASVAAAAKIGIAAAGQAGAVAAGKQLLNINVTLAATGTVAKTNTQTSNGSAVLKLTQPSDGWFVGQALTGTGIPASTSIGAIDVTGTLVSMVQVGTTTAQLATATGGVTVTATNNDGTLYWNSCTFDYPFVQGQIT